MKQVRNPIPNELINWAERPQSVYSIFNSRQKRFEAPNVYAAYRSCSIRHHRHSANKHNILDFVNVECVKIDGCSQWIQNIYSACTALDIGSLRPIPQFQEATNNQKILSHEGISINVCWWWRGDDVSIAKAPLNMNNWYVCTILRSFYIPCQRRDVNWNRNRNIVFSSVFIHVYIYICRYCDRRCRYTLRSPYWFILTDQWSRPFTQLKLIRNSCTTSRAF